MTQARGLGLLPGSALSADVEHNDRARSSCISAVRTYVSEWTRALHREGYLAGVYVHQDSGLRDLEVGTTRVWDRISTGGYVSDHYVSTRSTTGFIAGIPRCSYPGQNTRSTELITRSGPGTTYSRKQPLQGGALACVACQAPGSLVRKTRVWNQLVDGRWVSDSYVSNRSNTMSSKPVPRCR